MEKTMALFCRRGHLGVQDSQMYEQHQGQNELVHRSRTQHNQALKTLLQPYLLHPCPNHFSLQQCYLNLRHPKFALITGILRFSRRIWILRCICTRGTRIFLGFGLVSSRQGGLSRLGMECGGESLGVVVAGLGYCYCIAAVGICSATSWRVTLLL
ncbi:hypothetical protein CC86DRAFT_162129 [Ophiobolus disseminans]|uniref:Uncharacterized protein n=1 Tax=Ophiobolus disseminans TaxID=1469910 RepID=A0A6A7AB63_9PLEO|nr:hypothetical protein CC86DRAFT_162129 [Ophiobolus disseminans]